MGKNSYIGGNTIVYMQNPRKILLKKIYDSASDLFDEELSLAFITKVFVEYNEHELYQIEKEISSFSKVKREFWVNLIKKYFSNRLNFSKEKKLPKNETKGIYGNIFKEENLNKKVEVKHKNPQINNLILNLEQLNLKIKNHPNILIRERSKKEVIQLQKRIDELIILENSTPKKRKR